MSQPSTKSHCQSTKSEVDTCMKKKKETKSIDLLAFAFSLLDQLAPVTTNHGDVGQDVTTNHGNLLGHVQDGKAGNTTPDGSG